MNLQSVHRGIFSTYPADPAREGTNNDDNCNNDKEDDEWEDVKKACRPSTTCEVDENDNDGKSNAESDLLWGLLSSSSAGHGPKNRRVVVGACRCHSLGRYPPDIHTQVVNSVKPGIRPLRATSLFIRHIRVRFACQLYWENLVWNASVVEVSSLSVYKPHVFKRDRSTCNLKIEIWVSLAS